MIFDGKWPMVKLVDVLTQYQEYIEEPEPVIYPKLSVKLYGKGVTLDEPTDGASLKMKRHQIAKSGQVILSEIWGKKGAIGFVPPEGDGALCTSHFFLFDVRLDRLDPRYLQAIFTANYLEDQLGAEARGTTGYAATRPKQLLSAVIPLPPLEEQRRIVGRIDALAARIAEARGLRERAVEETEALWLSTQRQIFTKQDCPWRELSVEACCEAIIDYRGRTPPISEDGIPHLTSANIRNGRIDWKVSKFVSEETYAAYMTRGIPKVGDVIFTMEAPLGEAAVILDNRRFSLAQRTLLLRGNPSYVTGEFLARLLTSPEIKTIIYSKATATTVKGIASKQLKRILLPLPSLAEQQRIVAYLDGLQAQVEALKAMQAATAAELDALLPSVLDRAFRGEL